MSFLLSIFLAFVLALNVSAQETDDIAASLNLPETVVLADGMTFEEYLLKQVLANAKPLKARINTLKYSVTCQLEKDTTSQNHIVRSTSGRIRPYRVGPNGT